MDSRVLNALATVALYPHLDGLSGSGVNDGGPEANGAEFPDSLAATILDEKAIDDAWKFDTGFNFGLALGAMLAQDPTHSPDLGDLILRTRRAIAEDAAAAA